ncbi:phosphoribosylglycinamide formyltransferase [Chitinasiproducens palmae]|uniref:Phosphoribosylglycinamide formyltransferase n=1 Tax=Chitinasiproducens palmae TaxID=1770053 RepID=A0A1H2PR57_9BURK|nr:phosphoribosylglycinamide formyltransferase [Chitinasiproducens palmae]SDV49375.1 formyltetrahydrofolate-dependent phosphoribosylglycinamide formyltransferase [Chitinasiproducens palmae]
MKKIVILISGRGSNMEAILRACAADRWPARIVAVISNRPDAAGLPVARQHGVATEVVDHRAYDGRAAFDAALADAIDAHAPDLVVLAGFMRVLTDGFVTRYSGRLINIHPSLLPSFAGLDTHRRALEAGVRWHGATVHFVSPTVDGGRIIAQCAVPVHPDDSPATLGERVLAAEHALYPRVVRGYVDDQIKLVDDDLLLAPQLWPSLACVHETAAADLLTQ